LANVNAGKHLFHYIINNIEIPDDWTPEDDIPDTDYKKELKTMQANSVIKFLLQIYQRLVDINDTSEVFTENEQLWSDYKEYCENSKSKCMSCNPFYKLISKYMEKDKVAGRRGKKYSQESLKNALSAYDIDNDDNE
jgi:hypothetical protein